VRGPWRSAAVVAGLLAIALSGCSTRGERLYRRAEAFFAQGKYELAAAEYRRIVDEEPRNGLAPDAEYKLAYIYREFYRNVPNAITTYWDLAGRYPRSGLADDALLWIVWLEARRLKNPAAAATICSEIERRHPNDARLLARALVEVARAQMAAGQLDEALQTARSVCSRFPGEDRTSAGATLLVADIAKKQGGDAKQVLALYQDVLNRYPETPAAAEAKRAIGWLYFDQKTEDAAKQRQEALRKANVIGRVGAFGGGDLTAPQRACDAFRALLKARGVSANLSDVMAASGAGFLFPFSPQSPGALPAPRNLFETAAAEYGFTHKAGGSPSAEDAYTALEQQLLHDQPVLIAYPAPDPTWVIVIGCRAAESKVYVMVAGRQSPTVIDKTAFVSRWGSVRGGLWGLPESVRFYQFALDSRTSTPTIAQTLDSALRRGVGEMQRREIAGVPQGLLAWEYVLQEVEACTREGDAARRLRIATWAKGGLNVHIASAEATAEFLARNAGQLSASGQIADVAESFVEFATQAKLLRGDLVAAGSGANDRWPGAAERAQKTYDALKRAQGRLEAAREKR
jgi:TolA-binding protein